MLWKLFSINPLGYKSPLLEPNFISSEPKTELYHYQRILNNFMISKNRQKHIRSLHQKKFRKVHQEFLVEGEKSVKELLQTQSPIIQIICTEEFFQKIDYLIHAQNIDCAVISEDLLGQISSLTSNSTALAIVPFFESKTLSLETKEYLLLLDNVQDPGNLGTIMRIADWYGISKIVCSPDCVDLYNPKVIASSMGSFLRIQIYYQSLREFFREFPHVPVYGALLEGQNIHEVKFDKQGGAILLGNESQGIHADNQGFIKYQVTIPRFGNAESLNVAMATAIFCDNLRRLVPLE